MKLYSKCLEGFFFFFVVVFNKDTEVIFYFFKIVVASREKVIDKRHYNLDLSDEIERVNYEPFIVNLGKNVSMELKEFHGAYYVGFSKTTPGSFEPRNRFNIPLSLLPNLKLATIAMIKHIEGN